MPLFDAANKAQQFYRVKLGKFEHQVNLDTYLQTV